MPSVVPSVASKGPAFRPPGPFRQLELSAHVEGALTGVLDLRQHDGRTVRVPLGGELVDDEVRRRFGAFTDRDVHADADPTDRADRSAARR